MNQDCVKRTANDRRLLIVGVHSIYLRRVPNSIYHYQVRHWRTMYRTMLMNSGKIRLANVSASSLTYKVPLLNTRVRDIRSGHQSRFQRQIERASRKG